MVRGIIINTLHPIKKSGVAMSEKIYHMLSDFILNTVRKDNELTMMRLIETADFNFPDKLEGNLAWHLYHVKLDLEAQGLLKIRIIEIGRRHRIQVLELTKRGRARVNQRMMH